MPNYRANAMPCNNNRQMRTPTCTAKRDVWNDMSLAMAYVPWQMWRDIYEAENGFCRGTIFQELDKPFLGKGGANR